MGIGQTHSQVQGAVNERSMGGVGKDGPRNCRHGELTKPERDFKRKKRGRRDVEIDRRVLNGHQLVLLEDRTAMKPDGTSGQYIIATEIVSNEDKVSLVHKRYISGLMKKQGYGNAYEGARAVFMNPERFRGIMGEHWIGYEARELLEDERGKGGVAKQLQLFGT